LIELYSCAPFLASYQWRDRHAAATSLKLASIRPARNKRCVGSRRLRHATSANRSVFRDLGFDEAEAKVLEVRAHLMAALREHIKEPGWMRNRAAKELSITQSRVSALGKKVRRDFSADMLLVFAARADRRLTLWLAITP
jgi:predicted XRE-type DNA-binding protein